MIKWAFAPFVFALAAAVLGFTNLAGTASGYVQLASLFVMALSIPWLIVGLAFSAKGKA